jgi:hypothetical protein
VSHGLQIEGRSGSHRDLADFARAMWRTSCLWFFVARAITYSALAAKWFYRP